MTGEQMVGMGKVLREAAQETVGYMKLWSVQSYIIARNGLGNEEVSTCMRMFNDDVREAVMLRAVDEGTDKWSRSESPLRQSALRSGLFTSSGVSTGSR